MCLFVETLRVLNRQFCFPEYHEIRMNRSRLSLLLREDPLSLKAVTIPNTLPKTEVKCRLIYGHAINSVTFERYLPKSIHRVKLVHADHLNYPFKLLDRSMFERVINENPGFDELLLLKNGLITDSTFSNVAFFDGKTWYTPAHPLLPGTCRQRLLDQGVLTEANIPVSRLKKFTTLSFINAMLDLGRSSISVDAIH